MFHLEFCWFFRTKLGNNWKILRKFQQKREWKIRTYFVVFLFFLYFVYTVYINYVTN